MNYSKKQIENATINYNNMLQIRTIDYYLKGTQDTNSAQKSMELHNTSVIEILNGNKEEERKWKLFWLNEEVKKDQKAEASKTKLAANKEASADILAPIKELKKLGVFGKWLNNSSNPFRKQHFNKKYTIEAVNAFLETL